MKKISLIILAILFISSIGYGQTKSGVRTDTLAADGVKQFEIAIDHGFTINVEGADTDSITYRYEFEGNELTYNTQFRDVDIDFSRKGNVAKLSFEFPKFNNYKGNGNFIQRFLHRLFGGETYIFSTEHQELTLIVPNNISIHAKTEFADLSLIELNGQHRIENRSGLVKMSDIKGKVMISNSFGDTDLHEVKGDINIYSRSGDILINHAEGNIQSEGAFSDQSISNIQGNVNIESRSGDIEANDIDGDVKVGGSFSDSQIEYVQGNVFIVGRSGKVSISNTTGDLSVQGSFLDISMQAVPGKVRIENRSGRVEAKRLEGPFQFNGSFTDIQLSDYQGHELKVQNRSGEVKVQALDTLRYVDVNNSFDDVKIMLLCPFKGSVDLVSTYGSIQTNLPIMMNGYETLDSGGNTDRIKGVAGSNPEAGKIKIKVESGSVELKVQDVTTESDN